MTKLLLAFLIPALVAGQPQPKEFKVTVKLDSIKLGDRIYLEYENIANRLNPLIIDSMDFKEDKIIFKGKIGEPVPAKIYWYKERKIDTALILKMMKDLPGSEEEKEELFNEEFLNYILNPIQQEAFDFFLMPGEITIKSKNKLLLSTVEGGTPVADFDRLKKEDADFFKKHISMMDNFAGMATMTKKDTAFEKKMMKKMDSLNRKKLDEVYLGYVRANPGSPLVMYALKKGLPPHIDSADKYIRLFYTLSAEVQQWPSAKRLIEKLEASRNAELGMMVSDFQQVDSTGKTLSFSAFRGQYVLLEFWASWCGPCRVKNPELIVVYDKYSHENFTILGIALEQKNDKEKWLKAIQKDKLKWPQVTDFKFWENSVARQFGIQAIPFNLLVDPTGKIVGKNLYGEELDHRLAEIFKK